MVKVLKINVEDFEFGHCEPRRRDRCIHVPSGAIGQCSKWENSGLNFRGAVLSVASNLLFLDWMQKERGYSVNRDELYLDAVQEWNDRLFFLFRLRKQSDGKGGIECSWSSLQGGTSKQGDGK